MLSYFFFPLGLCCKLLHFPRCLTAWDRNIPFPPLKPQKNKGWQTRSAMRTQEQLHIDEENTALQ